MADAKSKLGFTKAVSAALCMLAALGSPSLVRAQDTSYRLGPGDRMEVNVYGAPDLQRRVTVNADGEVSFPLLGNIPVARKTLGETRELLQNLLAEKKIVQRPDVTLEIYEHRPFFINGDVARPGSYQFQPGLTIRQAVTLAGGYDMVRFRFGANPFIQAADLRMEYEQYRADALRDEVRLKRLQAELAGKPVIEVGDVSAYLVSPALFQEVTEIERRQLRERLENAERERMSYRRSIDLARDQLKTYEDQQRLDNEAMAVQQEELAKIKALNERGMVPSSRLNDEQRTSVFNRSRFLQTANNVAAARRAIEELQRQVDRAEEVRKIDIMREITETTLSIERTRSRLQATAEKFAIVGSTRSTLTARGTEADVTIFRRTPTRTERIVATEDSKILPDDVVEIQLKQLKLLGAALDTGEVAATR